MTVLSDFTVKSCHVSLLDPHSSLKDPFIPPVPNGIRNNTGSVKELDPTTSSHLEFIVTGEDSFEQSHALLVIRNGPPRIYPAMNQNLLATSQLKK